MSQTQFSQVFFLLTVICNIVFLLAISAGPLKRLCWRWRLRREQERRLKTERFNREYDRFIESLKP